MTDDRFPRSMEWFFLRLNDDVLGSTPWKKVTRDEFIRAERAAGFRPKGGGDGLATGGFGSGNREGRVVHPHYLSPDSYAWDPEFQAVLDLTPTKDES